MASPFLGEIIMFGGNFAPRGWAFCDGQLLPVASFTALFSILGTTYGGDGRTNFALPDLRGRVPIHPGNGPGLSAYQLGQRGGQENVTLTTNQIPSHAHPAQNNTVDDDPNTLTASGSTLANGGFYSTDAPSGSTQPVSTANAGGGQSHPNRQPYVCVNYIIALQGVFPTRN